MPRKPKFVHPLRAVRNIIGDSQPAFAAKVGCSAATIQSIENGKFKLSDGIAARIRIYTGANSYELIQGRKGKALTPSGAPYSREYFLEWRKIQNRPLPHSRIKNVLSWTDLLLRVSYHKKKFAQVHDALCEWLDNASRDFGLVHALNAECQKLVFTKSETRTVRQWRIDKVAAECWGFKDSKTFNPDQSMTFTRPVSLPWLPGAEFPKP